MNHCSSSDGIQYFEGKNSLKCIFTLAFVPEVFTDNVLWIPDHTYYESENKS